LLQPLDESRICSPSVTYLICFEDLGIFSDGQSTSDDDRLTICNETGNNQPISTSAIIYHLLLMSDRHRI
jgi:hypothetical protein